MPIISPDNWKPIGVKNLEPVAEEAVRELNRNILLTAGPGAGKTELLAQRACFLLQTGMCPFPMRILAISFKKDAARNLKDRVELRCGNELAKRFISLTFDAFAKSILDRFRLGLPDDWRPTKDYMIDYDITKLNQMQDILQRVLSKGGFNQRQIESYDPKTFERKILTDLSISNIHDKAAILIWNFLLKGMPSSSLIFTMISRLSEHIFNCNPLLLKALRYTYSYVFLDEFQDTTKIQYDLTCTCFKNTKLILTAVGDDKQRIMTWAGAVKNVFNVFIKDFSAVPKYLISNYRSIPELVRIQHSIAKALDPNVKQSISMVDGTVDKECCKIYVCDSDTIEAQVVSKNILNWIKEERLRPKDICVLVRQTPQRYTEKIIEILNKSGIKSRNESELQDLRSEPITDLLISMLNLLVLEKSPTDWNKIVEFLFSSKKIDGESTNEIEDCLGNFIKKNRIIFKKSDKWSLDSIKTILNIILKYLEEDNIKITYPQYEQGTYLQENIDKISEYLLERLNVMNWQETLYDFQGYDSIPIMTLHKSKGLEFHTVVFIGLEDQSLWNYNANPDEETCGFFVAFSRAKKRMIMTASLSRPDRLGKIRAQTINSVRPLYDILSQAEIKPERISKI